MNQFFWVPQPRTFSPQESLINYVLPICSMYGIFTYIWDTCMVNVGKYSRHGASRLVLGSIILSYCWCFKRTNKSTKACIQASISRMEVVRPVGQLMVSPPPGISEIPAYCSHHIGRYLRAPNWAYILYCQKDSHHEFKETNHPKRPTTLQYSSMLMTTLP